MKKYLIALRAIWRKKGLEWLLILGLFPIMIDYIVNMINNIDVIAKVVHSATFGLMLESFLAKIFGDHTLIKWIWFIILCYNWTSNKSTRLMSLGWSWSNCTESWLKVKTLKLLNSRNLIELSLLRSCTRRMVAANRIEMLIQFNWQGTSFKLKEFFLLLGLHFEFIILNFKKY